MAAWASTGLKRLDFILNDLRKGDNVVWQVDHIDDFQRFVTPYVEKALKDGRNIVYMRFANHAPLVNPAYKVKTYNLNASSGFETFSSEVHRIIASEGKEAYYVFDCLSDLLNAWATDLMIGNFFMITCPFLFELDTIAYFALLRNNHSFKTIARIRETTQLLLDVYNIDKTVYVHPLKVWKRYSPTMFLPHKDGGEDFVPITNSVETTKLISHISQQGLQPAQRVLDYWDRLFLRCEQLATDKHALSSEKQHTVEQICKIMIARESRIFSLAKQHFTLEDLLTIKKRLIGTGFIGGKAVGMLLANKIISKESSGHLAQYLEPHDSFYVGSDVFYTYIVENGWWKLRMEQKTKEGYFEVANKLKEKMLTGVFPDQIREQFQEMVEYFGQSPIIVRSSSLLEDAFGNAFAGKYASFFLANQGSPEERYAQLEDTIRKVYASTMNENALTYRLQRGLDQQDEQMSLLIQRVSGSYRKEYFFPDLAGVGISYNTFTWNPELNPKAGMLRLVCGLGTRAVNRVEDDYPRIVALDAPLLSPISGLEDLRKFSQHWVDLLDMKENTLRTISSVQLFNTEVGLPLDLIAVTDPEITHRAKQLNPDAQTHWILTFEKALSNTSFCEVMRKILNTLEARYDYPVDVEFTVNFTTDKRFVINLLQCRPLQTKGPQARVKIPDEIDVNKIFFRCKECSMGGNISLSLKHIIFVDPKPYIDLPLTQKYDIARLVGKLNKQIADKQNELTILCGPGRWGTTTPSLGVPVGFNEISNITVLVEIAYEGGNLMPELSFGTHFFQDLVENDIFYTAIFSDRENVVFNPDLIDSMENKLTKFLPEAEKYTNVLKVCSIVSGQLQIISDVLTQQVICFFN